MDRFHVTQMGRALLAALAAFWRGCAHRRTTFPMTLPASASVDLPPISQSETYIVCLDCGRRFAYDWTTMRITKSSTASPTLVPAVDEARQGSR